MKNETNQISPVCRRRLHIQGYENYSDNELNEFKYGIRFAYGLCVTLAALGLVLGNLPLLTGVALVAFVAMFPPYHPFDYLYNYAVRHLIGKPKVPPRTKQGRFACGIAFIWLALIIYFLSTGQVMVSNILGAMLVGVGLLVSVLDICIPSMVYNLLFRSKKDNK